MEILGSFFLFCLEVGQKKMEWNGRRIVRNINSGAVGGGDKNYQGLELVKRKSQKLGK